MSTDDQINNFSTEKSTADKVDPKKNDNKKVDRDTKINHVLRNAGFAFLFFLLGALVVGLAFYLPANSKLQTAQSEVDRLLPIESDYNTLLVEFGQISAQRSIYKILANASLMRVALVDNQSSRIDQYMRYIEDDLSKLSLADFPDLPASLQGQFLLVSKNAEKDKTAALRELQAFQNDLLLLIDNLE